MFLPAYELQLKLGITYTYLGHTRKATGIYLSKLKKNVPLNHATIIDR